MIFRTIAILIIICLLFATSASISLAHVWQIEPVADNSGIGCDCDLEIDAVGGLHVGFNTEYNDGECVDYACKTSDDDSWIIDNYDCVPIWFIGHNSEIALTSTGQFGAVYDQIENIPPPKTRDDYVNVINYASYDGGSWSIEQVTDDGEDLAGSISLAYDNSNVPHLFYGEQDNGTCRIFHRWKQDSEWQIELIDSNDAQDVHGLIDDSDVKHIAYYHNNHRTLKYGVNSGSGWQLTTIESPGATCSGLDMVLDENGIPHVVFRGPGWLLRHGWFDGENWQVETIYDDALGFPSIAIDPSGTIHVCYSIFSESTDRPLAYSSNDGSGWVTEVVDQEVSCWNTAMDIDPSGLPHIIYLDNSTERTMHAWARDLAAIDGDPCESAVPSLYLKSAYPNPSDGSTTIEFQLPMATSANLSLLDVTGRLIETRNLGALAYGRHVIELNDLPRGVVFYRLETGTQTATRKLIVR
jgi:Secretion system C-terminal sorting domain